MAIEIPDVIDCVDCGQKAHRLTHTPEDGWETGDMVAYRCSGCNDRWDLVVEDPSDSGDRGSGSEFDFRAFLQGRQKDAE